MKGCKGRVLAMLYLPVIFSVILLSCASDISHDHSGHNMMLSEDGMVMNNNAHRLPFGCDVISKQYEFVVSAGRRYAADNPGAVFGMSQHDYRVEACSRISVVFSNEDEVRHQWMVHGLPKYLYPGGMFHLEAMAGKTIQGTFIVPAGDQTYLVHCDMAQHMEKGMKGQLVVGNGSGNLWNVYNTSDTFLKSEYLPAHTSRWVLLFAVIAFILTYGLLRR
ncbi:MAG: hypothetical protein KUG79_07355 [Pseudomonadales bacterium]|nr:hypothetical protein [Pseudomonadales bacterium]